MDGSVFQKTLGLPVSRETFNRLGLYVNLLLKWNRHINLIGSATLEQVWYRHILDSAQLLLYISASNGECLSAADLGSGAGLPGIVWSILTNNPIDLIESDQRKSHFLSHAIHALDLPARVIPSRIEELDSTYDVLFARAFAPLPRLLTLTKRIRHQNSVCLFHKGMRYQSEIELALCDWVFEYQTYPSITDKDSSIIRITSVESIS